MSQAIPAAALLLTAASAAGQAVSPLHSTYLGGDGTDVITSVATDPAGNVYVAGFTYSSNLPVTPGAFQPTHGGVPGTVFSIFQAPPLPDAFVAKFDDSGGLVYLTYLGGQAYDTAEAIAVDPEGNAIVAGRTSSPNFPVTAHALSTIPAGGPGQQSFVAKLNASGSALLFATYFGGSNDSITTLAADSKGDVYLSGNARSAQFPVTPGALGAGVSGGAFVSKLRADGSTLLYSALLGGDPGDSATGIAVDGLGNAYVAGTASPGTFPVTPGAFQSTLSAITCGFVAKLNPSGTTLLQSTLLGGSKDTLPAGRIALDSAGNVALTGLTLAPDFPTTPGAFQGVMTGLENAFVTKLNATFSGLVFSTFLGGTSIEQGSGVTEDGAGNLWVAGATSSTDFPITTPEVTRAFAGSPRVSRGGSPFGMNPIAVPGSDVFLAELSPDGHSLRFSSTLSGSNQEMSGGLAIDPSGSITVVGSTRSDDFPATLDAFQDQRYQATCSFIGSPSASDTQPCEDAFLARFGPGPVPAQPLAILNRAGYQPTPVAPNEVVALFGQGIGPEAPTGLVVDPAGFVSSTNAGIRVLF